jgi:hypothetical protein
MQLTTFSLFEGRDLPAQLKNCSKQSMNVTNVVSPKIHGSHSPNHCLLRRDPAPIRMKRFVLLRIAPSRFPQVCAVGCPVPCR